MGNTPLLIIKIGGRPAENDALMLSLARDMLREIKRGKRVLLVHGGGASISRLQESFGIQPQFADGLRLTSPEEMPLVDMALCGAVNKHLVRLLSSAGLKAWGLSGTDGGLFLAETADMGGGAAHKITDEGAPVGPAGNPAANPAGSAGASKRTEGSPTAAAAPQSTENRTGRIVQVNPLPLELLWQHGFTPVLAPPSLNSAGLGMNINADEAALETAAALKADTLVFLSDVPGVMEEKTIIPVLTPEDIENKIRTGVISGGMIPKTRSASGALSRGVGEVIIGSCAEGVQLKNILGGNQGTRIRRAEKGGRDNG